VCSTHINTRARARTHTRTHTQTRVTYTAWESTRAELSTCNVRVYDLRNKETYHSVKRELLTQKRPTTFPGLGKHDSGVINVPDAIAPHLSAVVQKLLLASALDEAKKKF
jgi:hypothetical protein